MKYFTKEVKIAILAIVGVGLLYFGLNFLKGISMFSNTATYYVSFNDISGLASSSPIYVDGYKVGVVKKINYDYSHRSKIMVEISVNDNLRIPKGSSAEIVSDMLGNVKLDILMANNPREKVEPGSVIEGGHNAGAIGQVKDMVPMIVTMLPKLDSILNNVNHLLANPAMAGTVTNVEKMTSNLTTTTQQLNALLATVNREVPQMTQSAGSILNNADSVMQRVNEINFEATLAKLDAVLTDAHEIMNNLNSDQSSIGLLMKDPELYNNLNKTVKSADSLLVNLREHPKRYVHFSIFGRKDK